MDEKVSDPLAAALEEHGRRIAKYESLCLHEDAHEVALAAPALLAALRAALELPAEWEGAAASADRAAERHAGMPSAAALSARAQVLADCATQLREALRASLAGKESDHA